MNINDYRIMYENKKDKKVVTHVLQSFFKIILFILLTVIVIIKIILATFPAYIILVIRKVFTKKNIYKPVKYYTHGKKELKFFVFNSNSWIIQRISLLPYVLTKKIHIVGSSFITSKMITDNPELEYIATNSYPGFYSLAFVRKSSKIAHEGLSLIEHEYIANKSFKTDMAIILKTIPALMFKNNNSCYSEYISIFDLEIDNTTMDQAIASIKSTIDQKQKKRFFFVNPDCMNKIYVAQKKLIETKNNYYTLVKKAEYVFPDGIGINIACNILHTPLKENVNGTDMLPYLCELSENNNYKLFLLGAKPGIANLMKKNLETKYPKLDIVGTRDGYFNWTKDSETIIKEINDSKTDILLVAFGVPLQEKWISENLASIDASVLLGVGGLFDFYSGNINRAPKWMREVGMEWFYRLLKEPKRMWKRYIIGNPLFIYRVKKWKKNLKRRPC